MLLKSEKKYTDRSENSGLFFTDDLQRDYSSDKNYFLDKKMYVTDFSQRDIYIYIHIWKIVGTITGKEVMTL